MEVFPVASDAENRIVIGGKRKSSSRRSSILKASKSPLKTGVLEDLDPNSQDEGCRAKKSRRSSGRRVSFAEKNEIKEFLVEEDWYSTSVANKDKENEILSPNKDADGEYREPVETIKGIESLLKGDIQANGGQIYKAEVKETPEVQFDKLSVTKAGQGINVDRGIVFQNVGHDQARHSIGMFVPTPTIQFQMANEHEDNASVEMDCTQCYDFTNLSHDGTGILDQDKTTVFDRDTGSDGELELTCTHQEIFFRDYPTAPLSSPVSKRPLNIESGDKMDGKSFIMSLGSKPSIELSNQLVKHPAVLTSNGSLLQKRVPLGELNVVSNTAMKDSYDSEDTISSPAPLDITSCHGCGILPSKLSEDHTRVFTADSDDTCALDLTLCHRQEQTFPELSRVPPQSLSNVEKKDASTFLKSLGKLSQSGPTVRREQFDQGSIKHFAPTENVHQQLDQENFGAKQDSLQAPAMNGQPFLVGLLTPPKAEPEITYFGCDENLDLTVCHSNSFLDSGQQQVVKRRSIYEPTNVDLTMCHGSGLVESPKTKSASDITDGNNETRTLHVDQGTFSDDATVNGSIAKGIAGAAESQISLGSLVLPQTKVQCTEGRHRNIDEMVQHEIGPYSANDVNQLSCGESLDLTLCHSNSILDSSQQQVVKRRSIYEPTNVDLTMCYGSGFVGSPKTDSASDATERTGTLGQGTFAGDSKAKVSIAKVVGGAAESKVPLGSLLLSQAKDQCNEGTHNTDELVHRESCTYSAQDVNQISRFKYNVDTPFRIMTSHMSSSGMQAGNHKDAMELTSTFAETRRFSEPEKADGVIGQDTLSSKSSFVNEEVDMSICGLNTTVQTYDSKSVFSDVREKSALSSTANFKSNSLPSTKDVNKSLMDQMSMVKSSVGFTAGFLEAGEAASISTSNDLEFNNQSICKTEEMNLSISDQSSALRFSGVHTERCSRPEDAKVSCHDDVHDSGLVTEEEMNMSLCQQKMVIADVADFDAESKDEPINVVSTNTEVKDNFSFVGEQNKQNLKLCRLSPGCGGYGELSVIDEEIGSEMTRSTVTDYSSGAMAMQSLQTTIKPITLDEFLNTAGVMFLNEEVFTHGNTIIASSAEAIAPRTEKEIVLSSLVHKPKTFCYEEIIQSIEEEIKLVKEGLDQQREELNTTNPTVFGEIQAASKDEALDLRKKLCCLKTMCEKTAEQEWMEGQLKLNKKILATLKENHEQISSDALVTEESLCLVDDCLNLIEKMDKELEEGMKGFYLSLESGEKKLQEHMLQIDEVEKIKGLLKSHEEELTELENQRSNLQSEKSELARRKEDLEGQVLEHEETMRSLKNKKQKLTSTNGTIKSMSQTLDILESLQEWSLEEWDSEHAKFTFLKQTLEMTVVFGAELGDGGSMPNREVKRIQLTPCLPDGGSRYHGILHRLVFLSVNQELLTKMTSSQADLTTTLQHLSKIVYKARYTGDEIYRIGLSHLMSFKENKLMVEFSSVKAFVKFLVEIQLDLQLYPDNVTFACLPKIGRYSQSEIESTLRAVHAGPRYLSRLVEAADQLLV